MSKHYSNKRKAKYVILALACTASFSLTGLAAACTPESTDTDNEKTTSREDTQLLKNGNFEFFDIPDKKDGQPAPEYLINNVNNWSHGGTTSYTMSGIVGTSEKAWERITASDLADKLDVNNARNSSDSDYKETYVDYNGMKSSDIPYKNTYAALNPDDDNKDENAVDPKTQFVEPKAHNIFKGDDGKPYYLNEKGEKQTIYEDENGDYFLAYDADKKEYSKPEGHVLMLHNYATAHNGIAQNYSSVEVSLPANTSAEVSVWVKTSDLFYHQGNEVKQDRGANITITHTVGSSTLDDFAITDINTEKLLGGKDGDYNGWVQYTVYVNACNFASSNITIKLGLGETGYPVEGYAFFDDVTVTKYLDLEDKDTSCTYLQNKAKIEADKSFCTLTSDADEKIFEADTQERNEGVVEDGGYNDKRFSESFHYLLDLTSEEAYKPVTFTGATVGLTVDSDSYVSSLNNSQKFVGNFSKLDELGKVKLPDELKNLKVAGNGGLDTSEDVLAYVPADYKFNDGQTKYYQKLNDALYGENGENSAKHLPNGNSADNNMLVMLSAKGAAYTSSFDLEIANEGYKIISFWVKTSDMNGSTAATVKLTEDGNEDNSTEITLDTTNIVTDIDDDNKDIYNGWVQCFFFVHNEIEKENDTDTKTLHVEFSFGNTSLNGTSVTSYKSGWVALANMQTLEVDEDTFSYTGSGSYTASLTLSEDEESKKHSAFDEVYGNQANKIETEIVDPSSYKGVNGRSSIVYYNEIGANPFDDYNTNPNAGLINKEYFIKGNYSGEWYDNLLSSFNISSVDALANWNEIFGSTSTQPLIIVNSLREGYVAVKGATAETLKDPNTTYFIKNENGEYEKVANDADFDENETYYSLQDVINYGFVGDNKTVAANGYTTVSVKVKVSKGAVAYIYLVDASATTNVLGFTAPSYTYWYDSDGNVLKSELDEKASLAEQRANILYTLRTDGLYEDAEGKLYANTWNYSKLYIDETAEYYDKNGNKVLFDNLVSGETYYDKDGKELSIVNGNELSHFLVTSDGVKIYEYKDGAYHYIVNGVTQKEVVNPFDPESRRYKTEISKDYKMEIGDTNGKWVTVNFVIHAGSESKSYRLELWSGARDEYTTAGNTEKGSVLFDYSYTNVSDDTLVKEHENDIIKAYQRILASKPDLLNAATSTENISYYENLIKQYIEEGKISQADVDKYEILKNYTANYFTYSLYDSADFQPFNKDVNENSTGYNYNVNDYEESLAYLELKYYDDYYDGDVYTIFTDYATVDQSISLDTVSDDEDDDEEEEENTSNTNIWLLASSIILVVALIFAMIAIFVRDTLKKRRRKKVLSKNNYNQTNRYRRKLGIKKEEIEEVDSPFETPAETEEQSASVEESEPTQTQESVEDTDSSDNEQE